MITDVVQDMLAKLSTSNLPDNLTPPLKENLNWKILNGVLPLLALPEVEKLKA